MSRIFYFTKDNFMLVLVRFVNFTVVLVPILYIYIYIYIYMIRYHNYTMTNVYTNIIINRNNYRNKYLE